MYEMEKAGLSHLMDPKQMIFTGDQSAVVRGVLNGTFDVGFVRTSMIEITKDENGEYIDKTLFKVLEPKFYELPNGDFFPFMHTTDIFPEWAMAALPHVEWQVAKEVSDALVAMSDHAHAGETWANDRVWAPKRCDSTQDLAQLAHQASVAGSIAGFRPPRSYFEVRYVTSFWQGLVSLSSLSIDSPSLSDFCLRQHYAPSR